MQLLANDVDTHEFIPGHMLGDVFGDVGTMLGRLFEVAAELRPDPSKDNPHQPEITGDIMPITPQTVWEERGPASPGAIDLSRRLEVMDAMGVERSMVFPTTAIGAMMVGNITDSQFVQRWGSDPSTFFGSMTRQEFARQFLRNYNEWVIDQIARCGDRLRVVGIIPTSQDLNEMMSTAKWLIESGVKAVYLQADEPPGGVSPANNALDPFWDLFQSTNTVVCLHIGSEFGFVDPRWAFAEAFADLFQSAELPNNDIKTFATLHFAIDNYLCAMVLGGVFERFPNLRFGIFEIAAHWAGNVARRMDMWVDVFRGASAARLPLKPSEYIHRNVRISPFFFEPVDRYIREDPFLADVLCYSSDYPHVEGGKNSMEIMHKKIDPFGDDIVKKFFRTNAEWVMP